MRRILFVGAIALVGLVAFAPVAQAHAVLESSDPSDASTLIAGPEIVTLTFTESPDVRYSSIKVLDTSGRAVHVGAATGNARTLRVAVGTLSKGVYTVTWRVLSRVDGHVTGGAFAFGVGVSPGASGTVNGSFAIPGPSALSIVGRWLFYAGVMMLLGAAVVGPFILGRAPGVLLWGGLGSAFVGVFAIAEAQRRAADIGVPGVLGSSVGRSLLWRAAGLTLALLVLAFAKGRPRAILAGAGALASIVAHVTFGHAGADGSGRIFAIVAQSVHVTAAGLWIGGLLVVLLALRALDPVARKRAVHRFSAMALWTVIAVAGTGTLRALDEVGSFDRLISTRFGLLVVVKIMLLLVLVLLGARNRFRHVPRADEDVTGLRRLGRVEIVLAALVLAATGMLSGVAPARSGGSTTGTYLIANGSDFATTVRARLVGSPGGPGPNSFSVHLTDYDSGAPIKARVRLTFRSRLRADVESTTLEMSGGLVGVYQGTGANLAFGGPWSVSVLVQMESDSVEVPLTVFPRVGRRITESPAPGEPTLYTVALEGGRTVQFYIDPGKSGRNEVHATFFAAGARETLATTDTVLVGTGPSGETIGLALRELSPGHHVSGLTLSPGSWRFDVAANDGEDALSAYFEQEIPT